MVDEAQRLAACSVDELASVGKRVVELNGIPVLLMWYDEEPIALHDTCIHRGRSLSEGVLLGSRLVCAGHQWAFDLKTGYCKARDRYQPSFPVCIANGTVFVDVPVAAAPEEDDSLVG